MNNRRWLSVAALLALSGLVAAQETEYVDLTVVGGVTITCYVDGVAQAGTHSQAHTRDERLINLALSYPDAVVSCDSTEQVVAELTAAGRDLVADDPAPDPDPDPDPGPDPDPDPDPDPGPPPPSSGRIPEIPFDHSMAPGAITSSSTLPASVGAGEVVALQATSTDDMTINCSGTDSAPAFIVGGVINGTGNGAIININGAHCHFVGTEFVNAQPRTAGSRHVLSEIEVSGLGKNCANIGGTEVVITQSEFHHCRPTGRDAHGIQISTGARNIWILDSASHNNSGNGFQATHCRSGCQDTRPSGIYLQGNEFYENREGNGLKWADNVIFESNTFHSYRRAAANQEWCFSDGFCGTWNSGSDGAAIVIGADNEPEGLTNVFVVNNLVYDTAQGFRVEDAVAPVIEGNIIENYGGRCLALDKTGEGIVFRNNVCRNGDRGIFQNWRDNFSLDVDGNTFETISGPAIEYEQRNVCEASTLTDNQFIGTGPVICGNTSAADTASINALPGASGNTFE